MLCVLTNERVRYSPHEPSLLQEQLHICAMQEVLVKPINNKLYNPFSTNCKLVNRQTDSVANFLQTSKFQRLRKRPIKVLERCEWIAIKKPSPLMHDSTIFPTRYLFSPKVLTSSCWLLMLT